MRHWLFPDLEKPGWRRKDEREEREDEHLKKHLIHHHPPFISPSYQPPNPNIQHWAFRDLPKKVPIKMSKDLKTVGLSL